MTLIGLSGYAQTGKDTVAAILVDRHRYTRVAFADKLKAIAEDIDPIVGRTGHRLGDDLGWLDDCIETNGEDRWSWAKRNPETRRFLQKLGEACRTHIDPNVWIDAALNNAPAGDIVISDVRYSNEAQAIVDMGGEIWRISRPGVGPANGHISETALDDWPFGRLITNDGTVEDLAGVVGFLVDLAEYRSAA